MNWEMSEQPLANKPSSPCACETAKMMPWITMPTDKTNGYVSGPRTHVKALTLPPFSHRTRLPISPVSWAAVPSLTFDLAACSSEQSNSSRTRCRGRLQKRI